MAAHRTRWSRGDILLNPLAQLVFAALICVVIPYVVQVWGHSQAWQFHESRNTAIAALAGLVGGFWLHRSVSDLPGMRESSGILPGYLASFSAVFFIILLFRIDYSRANLMLGFGLAVIWFFLVYIFTQRRTQLVLGLVEGGRVDYFSEMEGVVARQVTLDDWPVRDVDAITADFRFDHSDAWEARLADFTLEGIPVYHSKDLYESLTGRAELEHLSENNFGTLSPHSVVLSAKMAIDWLTALIAIVALSPLLLLTAIAIRLDSPGPALFVQQRMGFRGRHFHVFKFRTMRTREDLGQAGKDGSGQLETYITRSNDKRITKLGQFLRRTRIDELPQMLNILRGEMSWIGPRPEAAKLSAWYQAEIPFYRYRHVVRPGISGWAQVNQGHVADVDDVRTKLQYDFYYIRNFSLWLDILIIMKTIKTMITGFGSK